jgi:glycerophosphoryl diester phosphodiesterase
MKATVGIACAALSMGLAGCAVFARAAELPRADAPCEQLPEPERWLNAGTPDVGRSPPLLSAHRGGMNLGPENTLPAYRNAFAYEMDFIEVDVRETLDGVFISMHDDSVDRTTDGTGKVAELTWAQIQALNAADFAPWQGSEYDPTRVPRLEEILELARATHKGIEFDVKTLTNPTQFFELVASYGVLSRSYFNLSGAAADQAQAINPEVRVIKNIAGDEPAEVLFAETSRSTVFGSRREEFTPEKIAAIHDGCSVVLPHTYDNTDLLEADEFMKARAAGADGAQVDTPNVVAFAASRRIAALFQYRSATRTACLLNAANGLALTQVPVNIRRGLDYFAIKITDREGCVGIPATPGTYIVRQESNQAIREASTRISVR